MLEGKQSESPVGGKFTPVWWRTEVEDERSAAAEVILSTAVAAEEAVATKLCMCCPSPGEKKKAPSAFISKGV